MSKIPFDIIKKQLSKDIQELLIIGDLKISSVKGNL